ncbi:hypothetical protein F7725_021535 [Dissostichus mawsoni]|uniref:Uncharacterized protein n=1 Tax=Dissostichus mawsoni TaxID=36200 RepID=A0A7J5ZBP2_DISMA|nr:hypothetical protein F7725_021535 [Dissostichus mawsoni]
MLGHESGDECAKIITLWQALGDFDKRKTSYPPRHKNTLKQGRFRATKKIVAPGVESTKRFSRRCRSQEEQILKQGIPAPDAPMAGPEKLLVSMQKGTSLYPGSLAEPHTFVLPSNTPGEAKLQNRSKPVAISQVPPPPPYYALPFLAPTPPFSTPYMVPSVQVPQVPGPSQVVPGSSQMMLLNMPLPSATQALTSSQSNVPYTTQQYRKRKEEREQSGSGKRKYSSPLVLKKSLQKVLDPSFPLVVGPGYLCKCLPPPRTASVEVIFPTAAMAGLGPRAVFGFMPPWPQNRQLAPVHPPSMWPDFLHRDVKGLLLLVPLEAVDDIDLQLELLHDDFPAEPRPRHDLFLRNNCLEAQPQPFPQLRKSCVSMVRGSHLWLLWH